jgi:hypothetical protein
MKQHHGMRPQDIVVLLKIIALNNNQWRNLDIAYLLKINPSEVSELLNRCKIAKLINKGKIISSTESYVWPNSIGNSRGQSINPLYKTVPDASMDDQAFYELTALVDTIRIGKAREVQIAIDELNKRIRT